jgi:hypothetical protein
MQHYCERLPPPRNVSIGPAVVDKHLNLKVCAGMGTSVATQSQENIPHYQRAANLDIHHDSHLHATQTITGPSGFGGPSYDCNTAVGTATLTVT